MDTLLLRVNRVGQLIDLDRDDISQNCESNESTGNNYCDCHRVFGQFKTLLISKKSSDQSLQAFWIFRHVPSRVFHHEVLFLHLSRVLRFSIGWGYPVMVLANTVIRVVIAFPNTVKATTTPATTSAAATAYSDSSK